MSGSGDKRVKAAGRGPSCLNAASDADKYGFAAGSTIAQKTRRPITDCKTYAVRLVRAGSALHTCVFVTRRVQSDSVYLLTRL